MKTIFHKDFYSIYSSDPASASGRMEAIVEAIEAQVAFVTAVPASEEDLLAVHSQAHIQSVRSQGLYEISALAAGGAIQAAETGLSEPCFALIRPPGHHASADSCWGFCFFNNMAVALKALKRRNKIRTAFVLDFDLHYGDGNVNILSGEEWVEILNPEADDAQVYVDEVSRVLENCDADIIGVSAGFDNHLQDWGGLLSTKDYETMGQLVRRASLDAGGGCFAILEGGYNHDVLGLNVKAFLDGMSVD